MEKSGWFFAALLLLCNPLVNKQVLAEDCDPLLVSDSDNPLSYRQRVSRCEGLYAQQVTSESIMLASLTSAYDEFDTSRLEALTINWASVPFDVSKIHIRGKALRWRLYYRMDAVRPASHNSFAWPISMLHALNIGRGDLGLLAWVTTEMGGVERNVHLPLSVSAEAGAKPHGDSYQLVVIPNVPMDEMFISIAMTDASGNPTEFIVDSEPLKYGYYPPNRPLHIPLTGFSGSGLYHVELGSRLRTGGASTLTLLVQHDAR